MNPPATSTVARIAWMFTFKREDGSTSIFSRHSQAGLGVQKRWFRKNFPKVVEFKIELDWSLRISQELHAEGGRAEELLREACRAREQSRTAVILRFGDPRKWPAMAVA